MKSILLIYKTKTGFTKKYVDWITERITCKTIQLDQFNYVDVDINDYQIIIYGAGMHAGRIQGLKEFKEKVLNLINKKIVVFATGGAPCSKEITSEIEMNNFSVDELNIIKFYYFQSGINYEKMGLIDKTIMKTYNRALKFKNNKSKMEDGTSNAISKSYDNSSSEYIKPMINYLKTIS